MHSYYSFVFCFFFQAEDGIRDFCLSRGLGDVYRDSDKIAALMEKNAEQVKAVVLADNIIAGEAKGFTKDWNINGEDVTLGVEKQ